MDYFKELPVTLTSPASDAQAIVPNDVQQLEIVSRALYVGQTGDISVEMLGGQIVNFANVQGGTVLAVRARRVRTTGTTAAGIVALW